MVNYWSKPTGRAVSNSIGKRSMRRPEDRADANNLNWSGSQNCSDEDLDDFEHYVQFKKENNKNHFKKLNIIENEKNGLMESPVKKEFKEDELGKSASSPSKRLYSADSPCRRHTITDPERASPTNRSKPRYNWWEYSNPAAAENNGHLASTISEATTIVTNFKNHAKNGSGRTFKESCGLIKL